MRRRQLIAAVSAIALLGAGFAAGCGSEGTTSASPETVVGKVPQQSTTTTTTPTAKGDPAKGKTVYISSGCGGCHTFTPAGTNGKVGPDLDQLADYAAKAGQPVDEFTSGAITSPPPKYVPPGFPTNVMQPNGGASINAQQLADLVAFLTQKS